MTLPSSCCLQLYQIGWDLYIETECPQYLERYVGIQLREMATMHASIAQDAVTSKQTTLDGGVGT